MSAGTSQPGLFNHITSLLDEVTGEKTAADREKQGMDDPGGHDGPSSHPSTKPDEDEQAPAEGAQSADNTKRVKEDVPEAVDSQADATPSNVPKQDDTQLGQGVDAAKATGEDASTEHDYKGKPEGDKQQGDMGGTTHPADGQYGEKYSAEKIASANDADLWQLTADVGNELAADVANGQVHDQQAPPATRSEKAAAAEAGAAVADAAGEYDANDDAANIITATVKTAEHHAELVADYLYREFDRVKQAMPMEGDPLSGEQEGEDHGSEEMPGEGGEGVPSEGGEELLAAMAGEGGEGMPPEMGMGEEMGEEMGGDMEAPPEALGGMGEEEAMQELAMALTELGISPEELAAAESEEAPKIAAAVQNFKAAGHFQITVADTAEKRAVRDYMKSYVSELRQRS